MAERTVKVSAHSSAISTSRAEDLANRGQLRDVLIHALEFGRRLGQRVLDRRPALLARARSQFRDRGNVALACGNGRIPMGEVNAEIVLDGAAEQRVERHTQALGFNIPQRHVDGRKARHQSRAVAPARGHVVDAIPVRLRAGGVETHILGFEPAQHGFGYVRTAFEGRLAESGNACVGVHLDEHQVAPANRDLVDLEAGDFDFSERGRCLKRRGQRNGGETLDQGSSVHSPESYPTREAAQKG